MQKKANPQVSQAVTTDPTYALNLAPNFAPDVDLIVAEGVAAFGVKGAGKSNACGRLLEQLSRFPIPYLVPDTKGEYTSLKDISHATRFVIATANTCPSGQEIISQRLQVVMDLRTWESDEGAALAMTQLLNELFAYASSQDPADCIPCPCILDEAQYWLPQNVVSYLSKDVAHELRDAWHKLATRARSLGLVPSYFTQNISELHKSVMRQCGLYILMRQVLDIDLDRYLEYIKSKSTAQQVKNAIRSFLAGKALVVLPSGEQVSVQFHARESKHASNTPTVRGLMRRLQSAAQAVSVPAPKSKKTRAPRTFTTEIEDHIYAALEHDSDLSPTELAARCGCSLEVAKQARTDFFYSHLSNVLVGGEK